jgi:hypothetical protein
MLEGLKLRNLATLKPNINDLSDGTINPLLMFAADSICWVVLILAQVSTV